MNERTVSWALNGRSRRLLLIAILPILAGLVLLGYGYFKPPQVEVNYINVGSSAVVGDSILLRSSEGKVVLIDGGYPNTGTLKFLTAENVTHIDLMVLTHGHDDHSGGLADVLKAIPVDKVVTNGLPLEDSPIYDNFEKALRESGVQAAVVKSGDKLPFGKLTFQVLSPRKVIPSLGHNNNSIVLRLAVGKVTFLFTGDMQNLEEDRLLKIGAPLHADILKVAHHGADTSTSPAFLEKVKPAVAIYSSGKGNMHGLPHKVTIDRLLASGVRLYGTDVNGTITVITDGSTYTVTTEHGGPIQP